MADDTADDTIARVTDPAYLGQLPQRPIEEIRAMRAECQKVETGMSYLRRVVQGRLDIAAAEATRRAEGGDPADVSRLVEQLPEILADHLRAPGFGRLPSGFDQGQLDPELEAEVEHEVAQLDDLASVTDQELVESRERLSALERRISACRRELFDRIDALQAELTRRYRAGEATVESLLR